MVAWVPHRHHPACPDKLSGTRAPDIATLCARLRDGSLPK